MLNVTICFIAISYGLKDFIQLWKKRAKSEAILILLLYGFSISYLVPIIGSTRPSVESLNRFIYNPISVYMRDLMKIRLADE
jgi:hypothetical protein